MSCLCSRTFVTDHDLCLNTLLGADNHRFLCLLVSNYRTIERCVSGSIVKEIGGLR